MGEILNSLLSFQPVLPWCLHQSNEQSITINPFLFSFRYFCAYAALAITFSYLLMITFFVAFMSFDVLRIKARRRDCLPICLAPPPELENAPCDEPRRQTSSRIMNRWATLLTFPVSKGFVVLLSFGLLGVGIYGTTKVTEK